MTTNQTQKSPYEDIINLPHYVSTKRTRMPLRDRAAQFAPFAALTGHEEAVKETARLTETRIQLDVDEIQLLDQKLQYIRDHLDTCPAVILTHFVPDARKAGGRYLEHEGVVKKIREYDHVIVMEDGTEIPIADIIRISRKEN